MSLPVFCFIFVEWFSGVDKKELSARLQGLQGLAAAEGFKEATGIEDSNAEGAAVKDTPSSEEQLLIDKRDDVALAPNAGQTTDETKQEGGHGECGSEKKVDADNGSKEEADHDKEEKGGLEVEVEVEVAAEVHENDEKMSADAAGTQGVEVEVVGGAEYVEGKGVGPNEEDSTGNDGPQHQSAG